MTHHPGIPAERSLNVATSPPEDRWERVGTALTARREQIDPSYENRSSFAKASGVDYRVLYDIEKGRRHNFTAKTITQIEQAYRLPDGAIESALEDEGFVDFSRMPVPRGGDDSRSSRTTRTQLSVVPAWVANEEQRFRQRLHQDAVHRGWDKTDRLVDGLSIDRQEDALWDLLGERNSPELRYDLIVHWRDRDEAIAGGLTTGDDSDVEQSNGTER